MLNDNVDLINKEKEELESFANVFEEGFQVKKKCKIYGWIDRTIKLSKDTHCIEWISEKINTNNNILNKRFIYLRDIKNIYRGDYPHSSFSFFNIFSLHKNENIPLLSSKICIVVEEYINNYLLEKIIIYDFQDHLLANFFYNGLILLKKHHDNQIYLPYHIPRDIIKKLQSMQNKENKEKFNYF